MHCSSHLFDPYSFSHALWGALQAWFLPLGFAVNLALQVAWEWLENTPPLIASFRQTAESRDYVGDTCLNAVGDVFAWTVGYALAALALSSLSSPQKVALALAADLALWWWISDSVLLMTSNAARSFASLLSHRARSSSNST